MPDTIFDPSESSSSDLADRLRGAGFDQAAIDGLVRVPSAESGQYARDRDAFGAYWRHAQALLDRLPAKPQRDEAARWIGEAVDGAARAARQAFLDAHVETLYRSLTDDLRAYRRLETVLSEAATAVPGLVPDDAAMAAETARPQAEKEGIEIDQGLFVGRLMARPTLGAHLTHAMMLPRPEALDRLASFRRDGKADLGRARVERRGGVAHVTMTYPETLNAEDASTLVPHETAVDLALLDPESKICVLRGGVVEHRKYRGRRVFNSGLNLTNLYWGRIPYAFYLARDLGLVNKMYRGLASPDAAPDETLPPAAEKLWIAAVEAFAIGGGCQLLLVMDYILAERDVYFTLPARKEGIIPGMANMRLPRFVGDRLTRQAIMHDRRIDCDSPEGRMICDELVATGAMDAAIDRVADSLMSSGVVSAAANRRAMRIVQEPLERFCAYMAVYAPEQAYCHTSPALIDNLERYWNASSRTPTGATA